MDKLLNVKEAAAFLNVSEMTIRRWTNAGILNCYRIGKKRERRFSPAELLDYVAGGAGAGKRISVGQKTLSLGYGGIEVPDGAHISHLYVDPEEALDLQTSYVRQGLVNGETVLVIAPDERRALLLQTLEQGGLDVSTLVARNRLHHDGGRQTPAELSEYITQVASTARGRFRLLGDMAWAKKRHWPLERIRTIEEATNGQSFSLPVWAGRILGPGNDDGHGNTPIRPIQRKIPEEFPGLTEMTTQRKKRRQHDSTGVGNFRKPRSRQQYGPTCPGRSRGDRP